MLLVNEYDGISMRSGVKSNTWDYNDLKVTEQFDFSMFSRNERSIKTEEDIKQRLVSYRGGHPSLAINFTKLGQENTFQTLPVFGGGWLLRNDDLSQDSEQKIKRIQVYWSSGRYNRDLSDKQRHLMHLCVAFNLMREYGKDFKVEFYQYNSTTMENFITGKARNGELYCWNDLERIIEDQKNPVMSFRY